MDQKRKVLVLSMLIALGLMFVLLSINTSPNLVGFTVYEGSCDGSISSQGFWELNSSEVCQDSAITIASSNITFECNAYPIIGNNTNNSIGINVLSNLVNVTIQNCNITQFDIPVFIGENTTASISGTYAEDSNQSCFVGNWSDLGGNNCSIPSVQSESNTTNQTNSSLFLNVTNQTIYVGQAFVYQIQYSNNSPIINFSIGNNSYFIVNSSGWILNFTALNQPGEFPIELTVTSEDNSSESETFSVVVIEEEENETSNNNDDDDNSASNDDDDDNDDSSASTAGGGGNICGENKAWSCTAWSECENGEQKRACEKLDQTCTDPLPPVKQSCDESVETQEAENAQCIPDWQCESQECFDGSVIQIGCVDLNECGVEFVEQSCPESQSTSSITGNVVSFLNGSNASSGSIVLLIVLIIAVGGLITLIVLHRKGIVKAIQKMKNASKSDKEKLWEWEEKNK